MVAMAFSSFTYFPAAWSNTVFYYLVFFFSSGVCTAFWENYRANASARSPNNSATECAWRFKIGSATVSNHWLWLWHASWNHNTLMFFLRSVWANMLLFPGFYVTLSRRLRHGHRMYVNPFLPLYSRHAYE